jgi:pimeloyl-ACP methyl ester carboxylesterase
MNLYCYAERDFNMNSRSYTILRFLGRLLLRGAVLIALLALAGMVYQTAATEADQRNFPPPGNLIDVGGFKMHIDCEGTGSPTVILESMAGGVSAQWGWIQPEVRKATRVCVYDRAGFGWSEPDPSAPTLERTIRNLHTLLVNANIQGPYVLVGHSLGGVYMRKYAAEYPDQVAGMVLIDSANPQQWVSYPELFAESDRFLGMLDGIQVATQLGIAHLYFDLGGKMDFSALPEPQKSQFEAIWSTPDYFRAQEAEMREARGIWAEALDLKGLEDRPLMILSRGVDLDHNWMAYESELTTLSTNSELLQVEGANHGGLVFQAEHARVVGEAIVQVVDSVRDGTRLAG